MFSTDVELPRDYQAQFAEHCIVCHGDPFRETMKISTHDVRLASLLFWFLIGSKKTVEFPCCHSCRSRLRRQRWIGGLATIGLLAVGVIAFYPILQEAALPWRRLGMLAVGCLFVSPIVFVELFWPPPFSITSSKKGVTYEFKDKGDAEEFAKLNADAEWIEIT